jgi:hypothetical protein
MTNTLSSLSVTQLQNVIRIKEQIEALEKQLAAVVGGSVSAPAPVVSAPAKPQKRFVSAATRAKMSAAHQARLAKSQGAAPAPAAKPAKKTQMSSAGRAAIVAAQKERWAKINAAKTTVAKPAVVAAKPVVAPKPTQRRKISPEGIARIVAATKARWARINAAKKR